MSLCSLFLFFLSLLFILSFLSYFLFIFLYISMFFDYSVAGKNPVRKNCLTVRRKPGRESHLCIAHFIYFKFHCLIVVIVISLFIYVLFVIFFCFSCVIDCFITLRVFSHFFQFFPVFYSIVNYV